MCPPDIDPSMASSSPRTRSQTLAITGRSNGRGDQQDSSNLRTKIGQDLDSFGRFPPFTTSAACFSTYRKWRQEIDPKERGIGGEIICYLLVLKRHHEAKHCSCKKGVESLTSKPANGILSEIISHSSMEYEKTSALRP